MHGVCGKGSKPEYKTQLGNDGDDPGLTVGMLKVVPEKRECEGGELLWLAAQTCNQRRGVFERKVWKRDAKDGKKKSVVATAVGTHYPSMRNRSTSFDFPTAESPSRIIFTAPFEVT